MRSEDVISLELHPRFFIRVEACSWFGYNVKSTFLGNIKAGRNVFEGDVLVALFREECRFWLYVIY